MGLSMYEERRLRKALTAAEADARAQRERAEKAEARLKAVETVVNGLRLDLNDRDMHEDFAGWEVEQFVRKAEAALRQADDVAQGGGE